MPYSRLCRKTTNRLRAIETRIANGWNDDVDRRRKTTNRLRAIETGSAALVLALLWLVARQLIAFGRLKRPGSRRRRRAIHRVARQLIAFGRLKP